MASHRKTHHQRITLGTAIVTMVAVAFSVGVLSVVNLARPSHHAAPRLRAFWSAIVNDRTLVSHPNIILLSESQTTTVMVHKGDTLSSISERVLGKKNLWPELWWMNRKHIPNPNLVLVGTRLHVSLQRHRVRPWIATRALAAIPKPKPRPVALDPIQATTVASAPAPTAQSISAQPVAQAPATYSGGSGFQACVIARESGGNPNAWNPNGHYGLYQFSAGTWAANGGNPADFGNASVSEQNQVFANTMATGGGASNWSPYDGC
jgi:hypothetical protein